MGVGVINVLILHTINWLELTGLFAKLLEFLNKMVFTHGFILLSGFGILYSLRKKSSYWAFLRKRIERVWLPFVIMDIPFALFYFFIGDYTFYEMLLDISSFDYFFYGKGMWYISTTMILYFISPFIYKVIFSAHVQKAFLVRSVLFRFVCALIILSVVLMIMSKLLPNYFTLTYTAWEMFPIYLIGMYIGWMSIEGKKISIYIIILLVLFFLSTYFFKSYSTLLEWVSTVDYRVLSILLISLISNTLNKQIKFLITFFEYLGKYSLEIYVLHLLVYFFVRRLLVLLAPNTDFNVNKFIIVAFVLCISIIIAPRVQKINCTIIERLKY